MSSRTTQKSTEDIKNFIENELKNKIFRELSLKKFRIVSEADLQAIVYFYLRRYLSKDQRWKIYNEISLSKSSNRRVYPDLVILRKMAQPKIAIELKEHKTLRKNDVLNDTRKLSKLPRHMKYGYLIYLTREMKTNYSPTLTERACNYMPKRYQKRVTPIVINVYDAIQKIEWEKWNNQWKKYSKLIIRR